MKGGNNRLPTVVKQLRGTARVDRAAAGEPRPPVLRRPCPSWLPPEGKRLWRYLAPRLAGLGVLSEVDLPAFELMCVHYATAREAALQIGKDGVMVPDPAHRAEDGSVPMRKHPALQVLRDSSTAFRGYAATFGLTPVDRGRLSVPEEEPMDDFSRFLAGVVAIGQGVSVGDD